MCNKYQAYDFKQYIYFYIKDIDISNQLKLVACGGKQSFPQDLTYLFCLKKTKSVCKSWGCWSPASVAVVPHIGHLITAYTC